MAQSPVFTRFNTFDNVLDDWLIVNQNKRQLLSDRENCLNLLKSLGFLVNKEKSTLIPTQTLIYLGGLFHLDKGLVVRTWSPETQKMVS
jgi:hypothetical protein